MNMGPTNTKHFRQFFSAVLIIGEGFTDKTHVFLREFCEVLIFTLRRIASFSVKHIAHVIQLSSDLKMRRIAASHLIAPVPDKESIGNFSINEKIGIAMSRGEICSGPKLSIAISVCGGSPKPTLTWGTNIDLAPKAHSHWGIWATLQMMKFEVLHRFALLPSKLATTTWGKMHRLVTSTLALAVFSKQAISGDPRGVILKVLREIGSWRTIAHVASPFLTIGHATGLLQAIAVALLLGNNISILPHLAPAEKG